jgi:hypothetical protein
MAHVTQHSPEEIRTWADQQIPYLIACWQELPEVFAEFGSWSAEEAQAYLEEWPLYEAQRQQLERASRDGLLTSEQQTSLVALRSLVDQHQDKLRALLG